MRDQPTPEQTPERIANISDAIAAHCAKFGDINYSGLSLDACVRQLVDDYDALTATLAHLTQERDEARQLADVYCPNCGSCGIKECCEAPRCAYFDIYAKDIAGQFREVVEDRDDWKKFADAQKARAEQAEAKVARVKAQLRLVRHEHRQCVITPYTQQDMRCLRCKELDAALVDPPVSSSTEHP